MSPPGAEAAALAAQAHAAAVAAAAQQQQQRQQPQQPQQRQERPPQRHMAEDGDDQARGSPSAAGGPGSRTGRFSEAEQAVLVAVIKEDEELRRSFLHRIRARQYEKKSWMHEIATRFNQRSHTQRTLDAVRHHFMLRRSGKDNQQSLVWHAMRCKRRAECTKCLLLDRYRVEAGLVSCGVPSCKLCKPGLPDVFDPFNAHELLDSRIGKGSPLGRLTGFAGVDSPHDRLLGAGAGAGGLVGSLAGSLAAATAGGFQLPASLAAQGGLSSAFAHDQLRSQLLGLAGPAATAAAAAIGHVKTEPGLAGLAGAGPDAVSMALGPLAQLAELQRVQSHEGLSGSNTSSNHLGSSNSTTLNHTNNPLTSVLAQLLAANSNHHQLTTNLTTNHLGLQGNGLGSPTGGLAAFGRTSSNSSSSTCGSAMPHCPVPGTHDKDCDDTTTTNNNNNTDAANNNNNNNNNNEDSGAFADHDGTPASLSTRSTSGGLDHNLLGHGASSSNPVDGTSLEAKLALFQRQQLLNQLLVQQYRQQAAAQQQQQQQQQQELQQRQLLALQRELERRQHQQAQQQQQQQQPQPQAHGEPAPLLGGLDLGALAAHPALLARLLSPSHAAAPAPPPGLSPSSSRVHPVPGSPSAKRKFDALAAFQRPPGKKRA